MPEINLEDLGKTITTAAEHVGKKTEAFIENQRLKAQIHSAERSVEKSYKDLGELIFRRYAAGEGVDEEAAAICEEISQIQRGIRELKAERAAAKGCRLCSVCQTEVPEGAQYCMKCGSRIPMVEPEEVYEETEEEEEIQTADSGQETEEA